MMGTHVTWWFAGWLLLLQKPGTDMLDVVENKPPDFRARRTKTPCRETLQRAHGATQLPREVGFADVAVEYRRS